MCAVVCDGVGGGNSSGSDQHETSTQKAAIFVHTCCPVDACFSTKTCAGNCFNKHLLTTPLKEHLRLLNLHLLGVGSPTKIDILTSLLET